MEVYVINRHAIKIYRPWERREEVLVHVQLIRVPMTRLSMNQMLFCCACELGFGIEFSRHVDDNPVTSGTDVKIVAKYESKPIRMQLSKAHVLIMSQSITFERHGP